MQKNFAMSAVAGFLVLFVLGYVVYGLALAAFFEANVGSASGVVRDPPVFWAIALGNLIFAAFLTMALGWKGVSTVGDGAKTGAVIGLLVALSYDLIMFGSTNLTTLTGVVGDVIAFALISAVGGGAIAAILNRGTGEAVPA